MNKKEKEAKAFSIWLMKIFYDETKLEDINSEEWRENADFFSSWGRALYDKKYTPKQAAPVLVKAFWMLKSNLFRQVKDMFSKLSSEQRLDVMRSYCKHCGIYDANIIQGCQCSNDE